MRGVFVTGTDTGIGKTTVSACLVRRLGARYWKPIQTGLDEDPGDTAEVARLASLEESRCHAPRYALRAPLSPEAAARLENIHIELEDFTLPAGPGPVVVEGAGGVLVPLNETALTIDLIARLGLPAILVARTALGTINHTLLSLRALRERKIGVIGVVLVGPENDANAADIAHHGRTRILGRLPWVAELTPAVISAWASVIDI